MKNISILIVAVLFVACRGEKKDVVVQTRTSGTVKILVDESFSSIIKDQIEVFNGDYKDAAFTVVSGNENKIIPTFLNDSTGVIILSRMLKPEEAKVYRSRNIIPKTSRFAIDGIALITNMANPDTAITVDQVIQILKGTAPEGSPNLVFDNAYSSTLRYFKDLAGINELPAKGVYTLEHNNDVIKYVAEHGNYIGIIGVNWLIDKNTEMSAYLSRVKTLGVKNLKGKLGDDGFYQPTQKNLMDATYPFLRNVYIINCEGRDGLGTGFANWLMSQRGQLIVLRSGLGPHKLMPREFNLKNTK